MSAPEHFSPQRFQERLARWQRLHEQEGSARSYPHAWRLPEMARPLGPEARLAARRALALDLFILDRAREAMGVIERDGRGAELKSLRLACGLRLGERLPDTAHLPPEDQAWLAWLSDDARRALALPLAPTPWSRLTEFWAACRTGQTADAAAAHRAAAHLRASSLAQGARASAMLAEGLFHLGPRWSLAWLDLALDECEALGQHFLKPRLWALKSTALESTGDLREAERFRRVREEWLRRTDSAAGDGGKDSHLGALP